MKTSLLIPASLIFLWISIFNGCGKDLPPYVPYSPYGPPPVLANSFTQEFDKYFSDLEKEGWVFKDQTNPSNGGWVRGIYSDKISTGPDISPAYSFPGGDPYDFAYVGVYQQHTVISSWMFSPPVILKNGDKVSFYTKCDSIGINRLEIRLNETDTSSIIGSQPEAIGKFTKLIGSVNPSSMINGYPKTWTKYEFTVSGFNNSKKSRIAFRYYVNNPNQVGAIGIDQFKYQKL